MGIPVFLTQFTLGVSMSALSARVVEEFYRFCNWAYEVWLTHRGLFDNNPRAEDLKNSFANDAMARLSEITQEYLLHQIAKLHDPAVQAGQVNLGIEYIVKFGAWSPAVLAELEQLQVKLNGFAQSLRGARNKILSHNDLVTILSGSTLGAFPAGADCAYFDSLQEFVNKVHSDVIGGPAPFNDLVSNDIAGLLGMLKSGEGNP